MIQNMFSKFQNILMHEKTEYRLSAGDICQVFLIQFHFGCAKFRKLLGNV